MLIDANYCKHSSSVPRGFMPPLLHVIKILKKNQSPGKIWVKVLKILTEGSVEFSALASSYIQLLLLFGEVEK